MVWQRGSQGGRSGTPQTPTTPARFKAPTTGLEDVCFKTDTFQNAADFLETKDKLVRYVGTCNYRGAVTASWVVDTMTTRTVTDVKRPDKPTFKNAEDEELDKTQNNYSYSTTVWR